MKLTFKGIAGKKVKDNNWGVQTIGIDGELLSYKETILLETIPDNIEFCFAGPAYAQKYKLFE